MSPDAVENLGSGLQASLIRALDRRALSPAQVLDLLRVAEIAALGQASHAVEFAEMAADVLSLVSSVETDAELRAESARMLRASALILEFCGVDTAAAEAAWFQYRRFLDEDTAKAIFALTALRSHLMHKGSSTHSREWVESAHAGFELGFEAAPKEFIHAVSHELACTLAIIMLSHGAFSTAGILAQEARNLERARKLPIPVASLLLATCALRAGNADAAMASLDEWAALEKDPRAGILMPLIHTMQAEASALRGDRPAAERHLSRASESQPATGSLLWLFAGMQKAFAHGRLGNVDQVLRVEQSIARAPIGELAIGRNCLAITQQIAGIARGMNDAGKVLAMSRQALTAARALDWDLLGYPDMERSSGHEGDHLFQLMGPAQQYSTQRNIEQNLAQAWRVYQLLVHRSDIEACIDWDRAATIALVARNARGQFMETVCLLQYFRDTLKEVPQAVGFEVALTGLSLEGMEAGSATVRRIAEILLANRDKLRSRADALWLVTEEIMAMDTDPAEPGLIEAVYGWVATTDVHLAIEDERERQLSRSVPL